MPNLKLSKQANKSLSKIPAKQRRQINERINKLASDPNAFHSVELKGYAPLRRAKSGEYHIIYQHDGEVLYVILIEKRNDDMVYRSLKRLPL